MTTDRLSSSKARIENIRRRQQAEEPVQLQLQLLPDIWPERVRALPNSMARCALFTSADKRKERRQYTQATLVSLEDMEVQYTGQELRQDDQDVWLQIVHIARAQRVGEWVETTGNKLLTALEWGRGKDRYLRLKQSIRRMTEATIWIVTPGQSIGMNRRLIENVIWDEADEEGGSAWRIRLDYRIADLFAPQDRSLVEWSTRLKLTPLAKWLHSFYATHRDPYPYRVETLYKLCGSTSARLSHFREDLKRALQKLVEVEFLVSWEHDNRSDTISVKRKPRLAVTKA